jgi:hypothetical protein
MGNSLIQVGRGGCILNRVARFGLVFEKFWKALIKTWALYMWEFSDVEKKATSISSKYDYFMETISQSISIIIPSVSQSLSNSVTLSFNHLVTKLHIHSVT